MKYVPQTLALAAAALGALCAAPAASARPLPAQPRVMAHRSMGRHHGMHHRMMRRGMMHRRSSMR